jgi:hypothetical protein
MAAPAIACAFAFADDVDLFIGVDVGTPDPFRLLVDSEVEVRSLAHFASSYSWTRFIWSRRFHLRGNPFPSRARSHSGNLQRNGFTP